MNENKKDLEYYRKNCEENYITTPISVLRYITELENLIEKLNKHDVSNCCKLIIDKAWDLYCREAGMCAGAVDYWGQVSVEAQNIYICKIVRGNNC